MMKEKEKTHESHNQNSQSNPYVFHKASLPLHLLIISREEGFRKGLGL
jgi:hypothetical protein